MRFALLMAAVLGGVSGVGCKGDPFRPDAAPVELDAYDPPWFFPAPGEAKDWDIQLAGYAPVKRTMMIVDLFDVVPSAQTVMYGDGTMLPIPAGSAPMTIDTLKSTMTKVICHIGMGAIRLSDPDASKFGGYEATPPTDPDPLAPGSVIGWRVDAANNDERYLDYRDAGAQTVLLGRIKLADLIGCDGIVAFRTDLSIAGTKHGFGTFPPEPERAWMLKLAEESHTLELSVGGRGVFSENIGQVKNAYDWLILERCGEETCDDARTFIEAKRSVFGLDYTVAEDGSTPNTIGSLCTKWGNAKVDGIMKVPALDGTAPTYCP